MPVVTATCAGWRGALCSTKGIPLCSEGSVFGNGSVSRNTKRSARSVSGARVTLRCNHKASALFFMCSQSTQGAVHDTPLNNHPDRAACVSFLGAFR